MNNLIIDTGPMSPAARRKCARAFRGLVRRRGLTIPKSSTRYPGANPADAPVAYDDSRKAPREGRYDGTEFWTYRCPHCGGESLNGDPKLGLKFRGGARCRDCGKGHSAVHTTPVKRGWTPRPSDVKPAEVFSEYSVGTTDATGIGKDTTTAPGGCSGCEHEKPAGAAHHPTEPDRYEETKATNCGDGAGGFQPGNSCSGKTKGQMIREKIAKNHQENQDAAKGATSVILSNGEDRGIVSIVIHRSPSQKGRWQLSWITYDGEPAGHTTYDTMEEAVSSASGVSTNGNPPIGNSSYKVTSARKPVAPDSHSRRDEPDRYAEHPCGDGGSIHGFHDENLCMELVRGHVHETHPHVALTDANSPHLHQVNRAVNHYRANGLNVNPDAESALSRFYQGKHQQVVAAFFSRNRDDGDVDRSLAINPSNLYWTAPRNIAKYAYDSGHSSTSHIHHPIFHEEGHYRHSTKLGPRYEGFGKGDPAFIPHQAMIAKDVSRYAATNPKEFVAEVYAAMRTGKRYPRPIMDLYRHYHGPKIGAVNDTYLREYED